MPPEIEIERLEWKVAGIQAEIEDGPMPLEKLINLCVLKHDCMAAISRFRAMRHNGDETPHQFLAAKPETGRQAGSGAYAARQPQRPHYRPVGFFQPCRPFSKLRSDSCPG